MQRAIVLVQDNFNPYVMIIYTALLTEEACRSLNGYRAPPINYPSNQIVKLYVFGTNYTFNMFYSLI